MPHLGKLIGVHRSTNFVDRIDCVGWDDTEVDDDETFREILRFICSNYLTSIKAILWHVLPNVRRDALLTRQARYLGSRHYRAVPVCLIPVLWGFIISV